MTNKIMQKAGTPIWQSQLAYNQGDLVTRNGRTYQANAAHTAEEFAVGVGENQWRLAGTRLYHNAVYTKVHNGVMFDDGYLRIVTWFDATISSSQSFILFRNLKTGSYLRTSYFAEKWFHSRSTERSAIGSGWSTNTGLLAWRATEDWTFQNLTNVDSWGNFDRGRAKIRLCTNAVGPANADMEYNVEITSYGSTMNVIVERMSDPSD